MTIDDLARAAATDARRKAAQQVDPTVMLERLHRRHRSNTIVSTVAALAVAAAVLVGGVVVVTQPPSDKQVNGPVATRPTRVDDPCGDAAITCLGANRFRVALAVPVIVSLPDSFQGGFARYGSNAVENYRSDRGTTGVTVLENARPVRYDSSWSRDPAAGKTAESMATWLSTRPFLAGARVIETTVGGRAAWRVAARLKPNATLPATKLGEGEVAPTFARANVSMGYSRTLLGDYTLLDVPGAGVTVIWSWTLSHPRAALAGNRPYVDGLSFETASSS
jgi:hypothetical protein